jgi:uridine monophosphate synthetase
VNQELLAKVVGALPGCGAFKLGAFRLKLHRTQPKAPLSPFYFDLRVLQSFPVVLLDSATILSELTQGLTFDLLAGVPNAATPFVTLMSQQLGVPMISPQKDTKGHGTGDEIYGVFEPGQVVLLADDLVTAADSKLEAIRRLEAHGLKVTDVVVLLDRQQGGGEELARAGYNLLSGVTADDLFPLIYAAGVLTQEAEDLCERYRRGELPSGWENDVEEGWNKVA